MTTSHPLPEPAPQWALFFLFCSVAAVAGPIVVTKWRQPLYYLYFLAPTSYVIFQIWRLST